MSKVKQTQQKGKKPKTQHEDFSSQITTPHVDHLIKQIRSNLEYLKKVLFHWSTLASGNNYLERRDKELLKKYVTYKHEYFESDQYGPNFALLENLNVNLERVVDESIIFKSFELFKNAKWPIRFNTKFVARINDYSVNEIYYILGYVYFLAQGNIVSKGALKSPWGYSRPLQTKYCSFNKFYVLKLFKEKNLFYQVGVQKIPVIKNGCIKRYEYRSYMHFLDVLGDQFVQNKGKLDERMKIFVSLVLDDVAKKDHSQQMEINNLRNLNFENYLFQPIVNDYTGRTEYYCRNLSDTQHKVYLPLEFKPYYVSDFENSSMIFDDKMKRWVSKDHLNFMERKKLAEYQKQISDSMIKRFVDFQSAKTLVELLTKIPNFKVNLTEQEKDVIGENGNVLAIGRSGTGKTTCAVLRLFSIEMLFKIRLSLYQKKFQDTVKDVRCGSADIDQTFGLHCIFLTASPVLTHQIQRYYKKLTDNIKQELERKKKKLQAEKQKRLEEKKMEQAEEVEEDHNNDSVQVLKEEVVHQEKKEAEDIEVPQSLPKTESNKSAQAIEEEQQINQQFKDIQLREDINNQKFDDQAEDEDIDDLKHKFEQNIKKYHTLYDLREEDYPGFFTVKSYIMLIDGILLKPFFIRSKNTVIEQDSRSAWHNERKGVMMIENYYRGQEDEKQQYNIQAIEEEINYSDEEELEHQYLRQIQLRQNKDKQQLTKKLYKNSNKNMLSFEVDYEYFIVHFWPMVVKRYYSSRNITPHLVWTEIYSTIKGSAEAHQYPGQYLTQNAYMNLTSNTFLTREQKLDIYETFCQYERWKIRSGGYDIMDAVNYILNYIRFRGYDGPQIHYIMIDQVQDLPHAIVYLLSKTATYGVFYSGDTAQTIAKGVGFRFCDLKSLFNSKTFSGSLTLKNPIIKHLTVNFRSHNNILQLANSIVSSLQILFPKTIDRLKKQISDLSGPKPMILSQSDEELLFYVLSGDEQKKTEPQIKKSPLEFGCDQVIIVRDQESKAKIPAMLQHALCLTVYEAKGLQFNDVILFNFFSETPCPQKWSILKNLYVITTQVPKQDYESNISRRKQTEKEQIQKKEEEEDNSQEMETFNPLTNTYSVKKIANNMGKNFNKDINDYAELCSELKLLYTAITRPRKTLIIYDSQETTARDTIEKLWDRLGVIEVVTKEMVLESDKKTTQSEEVKVFKKIIATTDKTSWKQQGLKMYARGYFDQAMKCFERSGNEQLFKKAEANKYADDATKKLIEIQSQRNAIKQNSHLYDKMKNSDLSRLKKELKHEQSRSLKKFEHAALIFEGLLMWKQAGQCYFSGKFFQKAFVCFCKAFMNKQAAQSLEMQNKYREAAEFYEKDGNYLKVIECLDLVNEWVLILEKINYFSTKMSEYEKQALLKKYSALALEELVYQIEFQHEEQGLKPENNRVEVIAERQSDEEEEEDSDEDPELAAEREYQRKLSAELSNKNASRKQSEASQQAKMIQIKDSICQKLEVKAQNAVQKIVSQQKADISVSFSDLNESSSIQPELIEVKQEIKPEIPVSKDISMSFQDLNQSSQKQCALQNNLIAIKKQQQIQLQSIQSSFQDLNAKYENDLEPDLQSIKSMVDPDDIWIKNSISEITNKLQSEYSAIDDSEQNYNLNVKIIKTKGNIFVQDQIMKKIVNIVSIINSSILEFFKQFKGYQSLITVSNKDQKEEVQIDQRPQISEFEDIDPKFINIILDTLESFKLFKLCLFVCNRYHMPSKAGRYLISLGMKYSTNCISNNVVNPILLAPSAYRKIEIQKGILASIALHSIYENVNAEFLKVKVTDKQEDNKNSLGSYFIQGLILQGAYKKAVFMVNPQQSLKILANYNDFQAYNNIYRQKILKNQENVNSLNFLLSLPAKTDQIEFTLMLLKKAVFDYCVVYKFQTIGLRYYKEFENNPQSPIEDKLKQYEIPSYLTFADILFKDRTTIITKLRPLIQDGYKILQKGNSLQVFDFISLLLIIIHNDQLQSQLVQQFTMDQFLQFYRCINYIRLVLRKITGNNVINIIDGVLNIHQCYRVKYCKSMTFINDIFCFVHRTSTVANELVENAKVNAHQFAYFFEQDYNLILSKTSRIVKIISKKYENSLIKLYRKRIAFTKYGSPLLSQDFICMEEEIVLKKALTLEIDLIIDPKKKKKEEKVDRKKSKQLKPNIDFKMHGRDQIMINEDYSESEESEQGQQQFKHYRPSMNPKMKYLSPLMLHSFLDSAKRAKQILDGKDLYGCAMNNYYRQYTVKMGGFNLFDAVQFKKFKRVDLFAENILSIFDSLTLYARHNYLAEILILLLVQYRSIDEPKGFSISITTQNLKYLQNLQFMSVKDQGEANEHKLHSEQVQYLLVNSYECIFNCKNEYVCEMSKKDLANIICDYLQILKDEQYSQFVNLPNIILCYVLNIQNDNEINESLRKIINLYAKQWKLQSLYPLVDSKSVNDYAKKRAAFMATQYRIIVEKTHNIFVENVGSLDKTIEQSEFDYQIQGRIIEGRKKAVSKIIRWWRAKRQALKATNSLKQNYLQLAVQPSLIEQVKKPDNYILGDIRLMASLHKSSDIFSELNLLIQTEKARQDLLSFYLVTTIGSSLDFHFILMSLNKIEECRSKYLEYSRRDIEYLGGDDIHEIREEMSEMLRTIDIWKNDEKWLRERNINLKRKKVFEVKWMTKNLAFTNILKKRAGLKKQEKLQQKARLIKRLK